MSAAPHAAIFPVRQGEEPWTDAEVAEIRKRLDEDAVGLRADIARAAAEVAERLTDSVSDSGDDQADAGIPFFPFALHFFDRLIVKSYIDGDNVVS